MFYPRRSFGAPRKRLRLGATVLAVLAFAAVACGGGSPEVSTDDAVRRGDEAMKKGEYPQAVNAYQIAVQNEPRNGDLRLKLAAAHRGAAQWADAVREAITASDLLPTNREAQLLAIEGMNRAHRFVDALDRLEPLMKEAPHDPRLLVLYGNARAQLPAITSALFELSEAWRLGRNFEAVRLHLRRPPTQADEKAAEAALRRALTLDPKSYDARMSLIGYLWATNRVDEGATLLKVAADEAPQHAFLSRTLGLYYETQQGHDNAEKYFKIAAVSGERESLLVLADYYVRRNRGAEALAILEPLAASGDDDGSAGAKAAEVELSLGRPDQARARIERVLEKSPNNSSALRVKAKALLDLGDKANALEIARRAVSTAPSSREARIVLGEALVAAGDLRGAFDQYSEGWRGNTRDSQVAKTLAGLALALGRDAIAEDLAIQSLRLKPGDLQVTLILVRAQIRLANFAAAERTLAPLIARDQKSPEMLALHGAILAGRGSQEAARAAFHRALQADPNSIEALGGLVPLEIKNRRTASVRQLVDQAVSRHPRDPAYLLLAAKIATAENEAMRAETMLRIVLQTAVENEEAVLLLANLLTRQGRASEAQAVIEKAVERVPSSSALRMALAGVLDLQGLAKEARTQYERVITDNQAPGATAEMQRTLYIASARLAVSLANQGTDLDKAFQLAAAAKQNLPNDADVADALGWVHVRNRRARLGLPHLEAAVRAQPESAPFRYHLGVAFEQVADFARARTELSRALELDPQFPGSSQARTLLAAIKR